MVLVESLDTRSSGGSGWKLRVHVSRQQTFSFKKCNEHSVFQGL